MGKAIDFRGYLSALFFPVRQFLVQLFPMLKPNELYWDSPFPDHALGQPQDALRLPHVEQINAGLIQAINSYYESNGILNAHHVACYARVCHGDWGVVVDLGLKPRDHTTCRSNYISEPDYNPFIFGDNQFTYPLAKPHDAGGIDGLITADEHIPSPTSPDGIQRP